MTSDQIVQIISVLAWPVTALLIALLFKGEVKRIIARLSSLSYKEVRADFEKDLREAEGDIQRLVPKEDKKTNIKARDEHNKDLSSYERLLRVAELSPRAAITEAWREIEITTKLLSDSFGLSESNQMPGARNIKELVNNNYLPSGAFEIYQKLRSLRTKAAHASDFEIDVSEALRYVESAHDFHDVLKSLLYEKTGKKMK